eukprot:Clim_evm21s66 gene=Clim_evmTU21s66
MKRDREETTRKTNAASDDRVGSKFKQAAPASITYRTFRINNTIADVIRTRGWTELRLDDGERLTKGKPDFHWADPGWIRRINHFRNHYEITKKNLLAKNLKRAKRQRDHVQRDLEKAYSKQDGPTAEFVNRTLTNSPASNDDRELTVQDVVHSILGEYEFFPATYVLPMEYSMLVEDFRKTRGAWIMKPTGRAQGKGIFLFNKLAQIQKWKNDTRKRFMITKYGSKDVQQCFLKIENLILLTLMAVQRIMINDKHCF